MTKLHQFIALHRAAFAAGEGALSKAYHAIQKSSLMAGLSKTYASEKEDGQQLPSEGVKLQLRVPVILDGTVPAMVRQFDLQATVDAGNQTSTAPIVVDGVTIVDNVPVETLLFLEKKLKDIIKNLLTNLPVVDEAEDWDDAGDSLSWKSKPSYKSRTDKVPTRFEKSPATDKHPAQVEILYLDEIVGTWTTVKFSGALKASQKAELLAKASKLLDAVQIARGEANSVEVQDKKIGQAIFDFLGWEQ